VLRRGVHVPGLGQAVDQNQMLYLQPPGDAGKRDVVAVHVGEPLRVDNQTALMGEIESLGFSKPVQYFQGSDSRLKWNLRWDF
jgi:hypothetical protein